MMFCLGATIGRRIGNPYLMRHLAAKSADLMLVNLPQLCRENADKGRWNFASGICIFWCVKETCAVQISKLLGNNSLPLTTFAGKAAEYLTINK
jgi:hypothetical protein